MHYCSTARTAASSTTTTCQSTRLLIPIAFWVCRRGRSATREKAPCRRPCIRLRHRTSISSVTAMDTIASLKTLKSTTAMLPPTGIRSACIERRGSLLYTATSLFVDDLGQTTWFKLPVFIDLRSAHESAAADRYLQPDKSVVI